MKNPTKSNRSPAGRRVNSVQFAKLARRLSLEAKEWGHEAPSFRSPPRIAGARRSITRRPDGSSCVSVATRNRAAVAVMADMIEGVLVSSQCESAAQGAFRDSLWDAVAPLLAELERTQSESKSHLRVA